MTTAHPSRSAYVLGCRCAGCTLTNTTYLRRRRAELATLHGRPLAELLVPAGFTRRTIDRLRADGWTLGEVATRSGVRYGTVHDIATQRRAHVRYRTALAIGRLIG